MYFLVVNCDNKNDGNVSTNSISGQGIKTITINKHDIHLTYRVNPEKPQIEFKDICKCKETSKTFV